MKWCCSSPSSAWTTRRSALICALAAVWCVAGALISTGAERAERLEALRRRARSHPLTFIYGLEGSRAPLIAQELSLSAIHVTLSTFTEERMQRARASLRAASEAQLPVIVALPCEAGRLHARAGDAGYAQKAAHDIEAAVSLLRDDRAILAWSTMDYPDEFLRPSSEGLQAFLRAKYVTLGELNRSWGTTLRRWGEISLTDAPQVDAKQPYGVGRAALDTALYRQWEMSELHRIWARAVRAADPTRPLFTGRLRSYRDLLAIPQAYDVIVPALPPAADARSRTAQWLAALSVARRGNHFLALPVLSAARLARADFAPRAELAGLGGAIGLGFEDWSALTLEPSLQRGVAEAARQARDAVTFGHRPEASAAVLLEPYAGGGLYGHLPNTPPDEPAKLLQALAYGSRFGPVDYLAEMDLAHTDLHKYGAILAPLAFCLGPKAQAALVTYVEQGGALAADIGLGLYQTGDWRKLPNKLAPLLGVEHIAQFKQWTSDMTINGHPLFPSLTAGVTIRGTAKQRVFEGWTQLAALGPGARALGVVTVAFEPDAGKPTLPGRPPPTRPLFAGLIVNPVRQGFAVYATHPLWPRWMPGSATWNGFHHDLIARRAVYGILQQQGLLARDVLVSSDGQAVYVLALKSSGTVNVHTRTAKARTYLGAFVLHNQAWRDDAGEPTGDAILSFDAERGRAAEAQPLPLEVRPREGTARSFVSVYGRGMVRFTLAGDGAKLNRVGRHLRLRQGEGSEVWLRLGDGVYRVAPRSRHRVLIEERHQQPVQVTLRADKQGRLELLRRFRLAEVTIQHAPEAAQ